MKKIICAIGILLCLVPLIGFGMCGLAGLTYGLGSAVSGDSGSIVLIGCGVLGIAISIGLGFAIRELSKSFGSRSPGE